MERRRDRRFDLAGTVRMEIGSKTHELPATDLSRTGVGIAIDVRLLGPKPHGQVWHCVIESPDLAAPITAFVSVMRIRHSHGKDLVGLRFESIDDDNLRIVKAYETLAKIREHRRGAPGSR